MRHEEVRSQVRRQDFEHRGEEQDARQAVHPVFFFRFVKHAPFSQWSGKSPKSRGGKALAGTYVKKSSLTFW